MYWYYPLPKLLVASRGALPPLSPLALKGTPSSSHGGEEAIKMNAF